MRVTDIESLILQHFMDEEPGFAQGYYDKPTASVINVHDSALEPPKHPPLQSYRWHPAQDACDKLKGN